MNEFENAIRLDPNYNTVYNYIKICKRKINKLSEEKQIGAERFNLFQQCPNSKTATIIIRGGAEQFSRIEAKNFLY